MSMVLELTKTNNEIIVVYTIADRGTNGFNLYQIVCDLLDLKDVKHLYQNYSVTHSSIVECTINNEKKKVCSLYYKKKVRDI